MQHPIAALSASASATWAATLFQEVVAAIEHTCALAVDGQAWCDVLKNAVGGISDIIHIPGLVNVDFEDVKTVTSEPGLGVMGAAVAGRTAYDDSLGDHLRVTVIATGLSSVARRAESRESRASQPLTVVSPAQPALRTGTDNLPVINQLAQPGAAAAPVQNSYEGLNTPSVWRSARSQAAAKVDALASNGMHEIEIPAFLRKQAD